MTRSRSGLVRGARGSLGDRCCGRQPVAGVFQHEARGRERAWIVLDEQNVSHRTFVLDGSLLPCAPCVIEH
jgi:hypothetical protein